MGVRCEMYDVEDATLSWSTRISISYFPYGGFPSQSRPDVDRPFGFKVISQLIQLRSQRNSSKTSRDWLDEEDAGISSCLST